MPHDLFSRTFPEISSPHFLFIINTMLWGGWMPNRHKEITASRAFLDTLCYYNCYFLTLAITFLAWTCLFCISFSLPRLICFRNIPDARNERGKSVLPCILASCMAKALKLPHPLCIPPFGTNFELMLFTNISGNSIHNAMPNKTIGKAT